MPPEAFTAAATAVTGSTSIWNIIALMIISVIGALSVWMSKRADANVKLAAAETELRKARRDQQMGELQSRFNDELTKAQSLVALTEERVREVNTTVEKHLDNHKDNENRTQNTMRDIDDRLRRIENSMISRSDVEAKIEKVEVEIGRLSDRLGAKMDKVTDTLNAVLANVTVGTTHTRRLMETD